MSSDTPTPLVAVLRHNFKQKFPAWRVQGDAADEIERLTRELAEARAEIERMKIDAGKAYCVYCGTSGPKADIWKHVTVCDKHPLKTMADKMEEASGMIQVAMLIFDELGLSGDATAVTAVESIQKLKAELAEYRAATDPHYVDELAAPKAENARMREALKAIADSSGMTQNGVWAAETAMVALAAHEKAVNGTKDKSKNMYGNSARSGMLGAI